MDIDRGLKTIFALFFRAHLTLNLKSVLRAKLLHVGVNTTDILTAYIAAIRSLRALDPSGVILEVVSEPVRKYLRTREDTVREELV